MKHTLLSIAFACSLAPALAQKGSVLYNGNIGGSNSIESYPNSSASGWYLLVNQRLGYQFADHWTVGLQGGYLRTRSAISNPLQEKILVSGEYGIGAFGRYTAYLGDRLFVYLQAEGGYNQSWRNDSDVVTYSKGRLGADLFPGVGVFIYKGWAANMTIGAVMLRYYYDGGHHTTINYNIGQSISFGISKNFGGSQRTINASKS